MKKCAGYIVMILFSAVYLVSSSSELTSRIVEKNTGPTPVISSDKYRYGDLFSLSYLSQFRIKPAPPFKITLPECKAEPNINLYIICDSYIESYLADKKFYCGVDSLFKTLIYDLGPLEVSINHNKKNVLLLEIAERNLRPAFNRTDHINNLIAVKSHNQTMEGSHLNWASLFSSVKNFMFNSLINTNLELNTWEYSIFTPIKEFKADLNYKLFNVVDDNVVVSPDKKYLFYQPTVDSTAITSSFNDVTDAEIGSIVEKLNFTYDSVKSFGFDQIYLAIIPNPVSVLSADYNGMKYNRLLERIQDSPDLKMPFINIFAAYKNARIPVFQPSDSHWSIDGAYMWLNKFNEKLVKVNAH